MNNINWSMLITKRVKEEALAQQERAQKVLNEDAWRVSEISLIANQLMAIEESEAGGDVPDLLPGTRSQWLSYRTKVRAWKEGHVDFPDETKRPTTPEA